MSEPPLHPGVRWAATIWATAFAALLVGGALFLFIAIRFDSGVVGAMVGAMVAGGIAGLLGPYIFRNLTSEGRNAAPVRPTRLNIAIQAALTVLSAAMLLYWVGLLLRPESKGFEAQDLTFPLLFLSNAWSLRMALRRRATLKP